ncbi:MAG: hypothetical protein RBT49_12345 [Bacteroidales bacterium]|jgi:ActR/RegA family two-component response regulator|nr:hypothetical protein [Bacteroidales bacterium]
MTTHTKQLVEILIMEDDVFYNNLIAKTIFNLQQKPEIKTRFNFTVKQYTKPDECLQKAKDNNFKQPITIAFIDYYLGDGINGKHLVNLLLERNKNIKIVLMSQSERIIEKTCVPELENSRFVKILKHNYTPDICSTIVENYINNL